MIWVTSTNEAKRRALVRSGALDARAVIRTPVQNMVQVFQLCWTIYGSIIVFGYVAYFSSPLFCFLFSVSGIGTLIRSSSLLGQRSCTTPDALPLSSPVRLHTCCWIRVAYTALSPVDDEHGCLLYSFILTRCVLVYDRCDDCKMAHVPGNGTSPGDNDAPGGDEGVGCDQLLFEFSYVSLILCWTIAPAVICVACTAAACCGDGRARDGSREARQQASAAAGVEVDVPPKYAETDPLLESAGGRRPERSSSPPPPIDFDEPRTPPPPIDRHDYE